MIIATTPSVGGFRVAETKGHVFGLVVRSRGLAGNLAAGLRSLVGGEIHEWRTGRVVVLDDTYEHEAWNRSRYTRVVLIFDIWNPYLTETERAAVTDVIGVIGDLRSAVERA